MPNQSKEKYPVIFFFTIFLASVESREKNKIAYSSFEFTNFFLAIQSVVLSLQTARGTFPCDLQNQLDKPSLMLCMT